MAGSSTTPTSNTATPPPGDQPAARYPADALPPDPRISLRSAIAVWMRNRDVFLRLWKWLLLPNIAEHAMTMLALGFGVGAFVSGFSGSSYAHFIAPGLVCASALWSAGFENSYGTFFRLNRQRTFDAIVATPVQVEDVVLGEILYGTSRSLVSGTLITVMFGAVGLFDSLWAVLLVPLSAAIGYMVASLGVSAAAKAPVMETLSYFISFFLMPMFWLSGIFYDPSKFARGIEWLQWLSPVYHAVIVGRQVATGHFEPSALVHIAVMVAIGVVFSMLAIRLMRARLIV